ncbi:CLI_3235 family bacteriocin precursor [Clostridium beijerinckii]|uniref:CLI_3235 family bacteriocin precursor n=1 Tax=Clostridium beijerinckii TaxID=1520 RepID=UPI0014943F42|nr:CLI_3235 family bacteriocin precursor [Clostridium beijerinckii]NOW07170.1 putative bacteriocin precursor [Clostridium beijerinckii]NYC05056.1 putative bacteriocin precursor [Clostridium beijerinckii]
MAKLGKKIHELIETIEAYNHCSSCSGIRDCTDKCDDYNRHDINTDEYNEEYDGHNQG